ncbi:MAG TPA: hypothetical protein VGH81_14910 [Rudaea sp.]|jgi:hypothetical protein
MRTLAIISLICCVAGCANVGLREYQAFELRDSDYGLIARAAVKLVERIGPVSQFVVPPDLDRRALAALKQLRPVIPASRLPGAPGLPAGFFLIETFSIETDGLATFEGDLGPTGCPGGCGKNISIPYILQGDDWYNPSFKIVDYAQHREVIPVNPRP